MHTLRQLSFFVLLLAFVNCDSPAPTTDDITEGADSTAVASPAEVEKTYQRIAYAEADPQVVGQEIEYATESTTMNGYLAYDSTQTGRRPAVIVIHEWWGHNDYARGRAEMLADLGYVALAVDMYGDGKLADHPEDAGKFSSMIMQNMDEAKARFEQAIKVLKANPLVDGDRIASIGYCFGGSVSLAMANAGYDLAAVAAFHSGITLPIMPDPENPPTAKVLVANGAADPFIKPADVAAWSKAMKEAGADYEYVAYPDTKHAYTDPGADAKGEKFNIPLAYNRESDVDSWVKLQALLDAAFE